MVISKVMLWYQPHDQSVNIAIFEKQHKIRQCSVLPTPCDRNETQQQTKPFLTSSVYQDELRLFTKKERFELDKGQSELKLLHQQYFLWREKKVLQKSLRVPGTFRFSAVSLCETEGCLFQVLSLGERFPPIPKYSALFLLDTTLRGKPTTKVTMLDKIFSRQVAQRPSKQQSIHTCMPRYIIMRSNGSRWLQMAPDKSKWLQITPDRPVTPDGPR